MKHSFDTGFLQCLFKDFKIDFLCCLLVLLCFVPISGRVLAIGSGQNTSSSDGFLWQQTLSGKTILTIHTIPDVNNDGHEDVVVVATDNTSQNCFLYILDGKTGGIIRTSGPLNFQPLEALVIESPLTRIAVAYYAGARSDGSDISGVKVYDMLLTEVADFQTKRGELAFPPSHLQTFSGNEIAFFYYYVDDVEGGYYLDCYSLLTNSLQWRTLVSTSPVPDLPWLAGLGWEAWTMTDLLTLNSTRMLLLYTLASYNGSTWANVYTDNGTVVSSVEDFGGPLGAEISGPLRLYNSTYFLYSYENGFGRYVRLSTISGPSEVDVWDTAVWNASGNDAIPIVDVNHDGMKDLVAIVGGHLAVLNGKDGKVLYTVPEVSASNISDVAIVSDVNNDSIPEVVVHADQSYLISFGPSSYQILWQQDFGSNGINSIQDVNGDGYRDVVAATGSQVRCFVGSVPLANNNPSAHPLFSDGFESGNFAGWNNGLNKAANGTGNVTTVMPKEGLYAANLSQASQSGSYARVDESLSTAQQTLYVRAYFYFNSLSIASGNAERLCRVKSGVYGSTAFLGLANNSGTMEFYIQDATNSSWTYDTVDKVTTGTYYSVEMKVYVGVGTTDGDIVLWVNSVQRAERTGMNLKQYGNSSEAQLGCVLSGGGGNVAVRLQLDSVVIDSSYITPISARVFLFSDDFESGNFSAGGWTNATTGSGATSVSRTNPYRGLCSAKFTANVPDTADMRKGGWALSSMNVRAYFYFSTMPLSGQFWNILMIRDSNTNAVVRLRIGNGTSLGTYWQLTYVSGEQTGIITNYTSISANTWYCLEIGGVRNAVNGSASYWVNGNLMASVQGLNDTSFGSYYGPRMGIQYSGSGTQSIKMYVDNVAVDSSYIGTVKP